MYIPEFIIGFFAGVIAEIAALIALALWLSKKKK